MWAMILAQLIVDDCWPCHLIVVDCRSLEAFAVDIEPVLPGPVFQFAVCGVMFDKLEAVALTCADADLDFSRLSDSVRFVCFVDATCDYIPDWITCHIIPLLCKAIL